MNIKNVMMMAAMMPAFALAETNSNCAPVSVEANDTTIRVNDQNIVIKQDGEQTSVKIYKMNGNEMNEMTKISETQFVDGQEVEKVFVTSPFIPQTLSKRKRSLESHYPTFFFGCSQLPGTADDGTLRERTEYGYDAANDGIMETEKTPTQSE